MPSTSKKQHNFMEAVAHNPSFAKKAGVPQSVGKDFSTADKGKTFKRGGDMAKANPFMEMIAKKKDMAKGKKEGMHKMPDGKMMKDSAMKHGGKVKKMAEGGMAMPKQSKVNVGMGNEYSPKPEQATVTMKKGGSVASTATVNAGKKQSMNYDTKPGKSVSMSAALPRKMPRVDTNPSNINGVAKYGKTQGKTVKMNMGGKAR